MPGAETLRIFGQDDGESALHLLDAAVPTFMGTVESDELVVLQRHAASITPSGVTGGVTDPYLWTGSAIRGAVEGTRHPGGRAGEVKGEADAAEMGPGIRGCGRLRVRTTRPSEPAKRRGWRKVEGL